MSDLSIGMLVKHASLGVGKIVAVEPTALHVFFPEGEKRYAAKLRLPDARRHLSVDGIDPDPWLEGLTSFSLDAASSRYALAANWITHEQALAEFLLAYPKGFADPAYVGTGSGKRERASHWRAAAAEWADAFPAGEGARLVAAGEIRDLVKRALRVERHVVLVPGTFEKGALAAALADPEAALAFFEALFALLSVPSPGRARFEKLFAAAEQLDVPPALAWPFATLFPFLADPTRHVFLSPRGTCEAAGRLGCDLRFDPEPGWPTYAALRALSTKLVGELGPAGARDFVDVEAFLHAIAGKRAAAAGSRKAKAR